MFTPKTDKIRALATLHPNVIAKLETMFAQSTAVYIDYANVRPWSLKLKWHIDIKRLKQFLDSFSTITSVNLYTGYLKGDADSEKEIKEATSYRYCVRTKPIKIMKLYIDTSSIKPSSRSLLKQFVKTSLLRKFDSNTIRHLNGVLHNLNSQGETHIEERKCNFDVEIASDMLLDNRDGKNQIFALWSGDSDFSDTISRLLSLGNKVYLFATAGRIAKELDGLKTKGLEIFDIYDLKDFICWTKEMSVNARRTP